MKVRSISTAQFRKTASARFSAIGQDRLGELINNGLIIDLADVVRRKLKRHKPNKFLKLLHQLHALDFRPFFIIKKEDDGSWTVFAFAKEDEPNAFSITSFIMDEETPMEPNSITTVEGEAIKTEAVISPRIKSVINSIKINDAHERELLGMHTDQVAAADQHILYVATYYLSDIAAKSHS